MDAQKLEQLSKLVRYFILTSTTAAGSGHPTSSMSATELMTVLFFNGFYHFDLENPESPKNDRLIFSKGHASPLFYSLYAAAGVVSYEELLTLRKSNSNLEGHPTSKFKYTEAPTGSLGQGLSIGLGMAMGGAPRVFILLGDSEVAEGSVWEAMSLASHYKVKNLVAILDVNRLGQSDATMLGWDIETYTKRAESFGWNTITLSNGHDGPSIINAYENALQSDKPTMIIAKTVKGKGISFLEDKPGWHGKALSKEDLEKALKELGEVDLDLRGEIGKP